MGAWRTDAAYPDVSRKITPAQAYWIGYMLERARDWWRRRDMALYPDTVEPRP
jgi:hypothetical protein